MASIANVTVHYSVWSDSRFDTLGLLLGVDTYSAIGRMTRLWSECTDAGTDTPAQHVITGCLGSANALEALISAGLGERTDTAVRVKGCNDRIEWLKKKRQNGAKGGLAKALAKSQATPIESYQNPSKPVAKVDFSYNSTSQSAPKPSETLAKLYPQGSRYSSPESENSSISEISGPRNLEKIKKAAAAHSSPNAGAHTLARVRRLSENWQPTEQQQQRCFQLSLDLSSEIVKFRAHAVSTSRTFTDENAAFSIWLEKSGERKSERRKPEPPTKMRPRMNLL